MEIFKVLVATTDGTLEVLQAEFASNGHGGKVDWANEFGENGTLESKSVPFGNFVAAAKNGTGLAGSRVERIDRKTSSWNPIRIRTDGRFPKKRGFADQVRLKEIRMNEFRERVIVEIRINGSLASSNPSLNTGIATGRGRRIKVN